MTEGVLSVNPNTMYPLLRRLEEQGLIEGNWEHPERRTRRFYSLTETGRAEYERLVEEVRPVPGVRGALDRRDRARGLRVVARSVAAAGRGAAGARGRRGPVARPEPLAQLRGGIRAGGGAEGRVAGGGLARGVGVGPRRPRPGDREGARARGRAGSRPWSTSSAWPAPRPPCSSPSQADGAQPRCSVELAYELVDAGPFSGLTDLLFIRRALRDALGPHRAPLRGRGRGPGGAAVAVLGMAKEPRNLTGKVVAITGAARGIGLATAKACAGEGHEGRDRRPRRG